MQVFGKEWFAAKQSTLLWFLNSWPFKRQFRRLLCIPRSEIDLDEVIVEIGPHYYKYAPRLGEDGRREFKMRVACNDKYARRLYYGLNPLWRAMHAWDSAIAETLVPALDLGFSTL